MLLETNMIPDPWDNPSLYLKNYFYKYNFIFENS